jgi:hypothetical protein
MQVFVEGQPPALVRDAGCYRDAPRLILEPPSVVLHGYLALARGLSQQEYQLYRLQRRLIRSRFEVMS